MFSARKVAQMAAVFAHNQGGTISVLKLVKLIYLADRESLAQFGSPITFDTLVAMPHGPVPSTTLNLMSGTVGGPLEAQWEEWISDRANHEVSVHRTFTREQLDELSDADLDVINCVWSTFGKMDKWSLRDYTHSNCKEWSDPNGSSTKIRDKDILLALGVDDDEATQLAEDVQLQRDLDRVFLSL